MDRLKPLMALLLLSSMSVNADIYGCKEDEKKASEFTSKRLWKLVVDQKDRKEIEFYNWGNQPGVFTITGKTKGLIVGSQKVQCNELICWMRMAGFDPKTYRFEFSYLSYGNHVG